MLLKTTVWRCHDTAPASVWVRPMLWAEDALQFAVAAVLFHAVTGSLRQGRTFAIMVCANVDPGFGVDVGSGSISYSSLFS